MNRSVSLVARSQARRRRRAMVALTVFVGIAGGISISLIGGSRRSATVVDRYFAQARHYDLGIYPAGSRREVLALPGVVRADPAAYLGMTAIDPNGKVLEGVNGNAADFSVIDPTFRIVDGSIPDGSDPSEVVVNESFTKQFGKSVGDEVRVRMFALDQNDEVSRGVYEPKGPEYTFRIAGVERSAQDISLGEQRSVGRSAYGDSNLMLVSGDFYEAHRSEFLDFGGGFTVKLRDPARDRKRFVAALADLAPVNGDPPQVIPFENAAQRSPLKTPVGLETTALLALGLGLALSSAIAIALITRAEQRSHDDDTPTLRALGSTAPQLGAVAALRALPVALGGAGIAVALTLALSARYPIGIGRQLELDPGLQANVAVLLLGVVVILAVVIGTAFLFGWPRRTRDVPPSKVGAFANWLGRTGAPTDLTVAAHLAFDRSRTVRAVPSRAAIAGGAILLAILTAIGIYVAGVDRLYSVPTARGWNWDAAIGNVNFPLSPATATKVAQDRRFDAHTAASEGHVSVNGKGVEFLAFDPSGSAPPTVVAGRLPERANEVALGAGALRDLGVHLGSTVDFSVANGEFDKGGPTRKRRMQVVGQALAPDLGGDLDIGKAGIVTFDGVTAAGGDASSQVELVRVKGDASIADLRAVDRAYTEEITNDAISSRIVNLHRVRGLPLIGLVLAALMGLFVLVYALAITVRARTRDLAVLRAIGLPARRVRRVLAWQGSLLGVGMAAIGIPAGLLLGSAVWGRVADQLGVQPGAQLPVLLLVVAPLTILVAIAASVYPGRRASREQVTALLRAE